MRILYDHQAFTMQYFGGVSKCFCELISNLPLDIEYNIGIEESNNIHLQKSNLYPQLRPVSFDKDSFTSKFNFKGKGRIFTLANRLFPFLPTTENINKAKSISLLKEGNFDIFHPTFFDDYYLSYLNGKPFVLTIHDMMPELFPEYFGKNNLQVLAKKKLVNKAAAIIAVSKQTKNDIINILGVPDNKIHVIYHGGPVRENLKTQLFSSSPFFLYVGQRGRYKNFRSLLKGFSSFILNKKEVKLICAGPKFTLSEIKMISEFGLEKNIVQKSVSDDELKVLYSNALAFIYPSLYEGFGMPILEAYAYGCPVILNHKSCFPEIAGDAAIYFESDNNSSNIHEVLNTFYSMTNFERNELIQKGYRRLSLFSWIKAAQMLGNVYQSIM